MPKMPGKRKSSIGRKSSAAKNMTIKRSFEMEHVTDQILATENVDRKIYRKSQTSSKDLFICIREAANTNHKHSNRKKNRFNDISLRIDNEIMHITQESRESRLEKIRKGVAEKGILEENKSLKVRIEAVNKKCLKKNRPDTQQIRKARLEAVRKRASEKRRLETDESRKRRLEEMARRNSEKRREEQLDSRKTRLEAVRKRVSEKRKKSKAKGNIILMEKRIRAPKSRGLDTNNLFLMGFSYSTDLNLDNYTNLAIGNIDVVCNYCNAVKF